MSNQRDVVLSTTFVNLKCNYTIWYTYKLLGSVYWFELVTLSQIDHFGPYSNQNIISILVDHLDMSVDRFWKLTSSTAIS